jgi:predicted DNA-binding helix-hairpin-helix protein
METLAKLKILRDLMHLEPTEETNLFGCVKKTRQSCNPDPYFVSHAQLPNGKQILLLKTLLTSACERNCNYCPLRAGREFHRETLKPNEMAQAFLSLQKAGIVQGIFLSSGIIGSGIKTQDLLLDTADILRYKYRFNGYIHLKLMPGIERDQVEQAMRLADRVSINLEAPNVDRLEKLAPRKGFMDELLAPLRWIDEIRRSRPRYLGWKGHWPSMTTQFVVGAVGENDLELLTTTRNLYNQLHLGRAYFSAFKPIGDTPFENLPATPPIREHRLYQASFLLRDYGFDLEELPFNNSGNLPVAIDPKVAWAEIYKRNSPVEINHANRRELLKLPGIGLKGVDSIITYRRKGKLKDIDDLRKVGINPSRVLPYILLDGKRPDRQLSFWKI